MVDPKGSPEIPNSADSTPSSKSVESSAPSSTRDPELDSLLRSRSSDDEEGTLPSSGKRPRKSKTAAKVQGKRNAKTGTSLDRKSKSSKLPLVALLVAGVLVLGGGGTAIWMTLDPGEAQIDPDRNKSKTKQAGSNPEAAAADIDREADAVFNTEEGIFPIALDDWQESIGTQGLSPEGRTELLSTYLGSDLSTSASILPAESSGFTSDEEKALNEDGSLNSAYSFWTQESFTADTGQILEKFLNPRFGNWEQYQGKGFDPNSIDPAALFPGTFTDEFLKNGEPVVNWLPIYADWNNNSYGRTDLSATGARWYGETELLMAEFVYNEETFQYDVKLEADVKFTAYKSNGEKVSEKGKLSLELVANPGSEKGSGGKVLVNRSNLTIGG